jgi:hypothetical protein
LDWSFTGLRHRAQRRSPPQGDEGMEVLTTGESFLFEGFRLDRRGLCRCDEREVFAPVAVGGRALDALRVLVEQAGDLVSKDEIVAAVWPGIVVEDCNLFVQMSALRRFSIGGERKGAAFRPSRGAVIVLSHR